MQLDYNVENTLQDLQDNFDAAIADGKFILAGEIATTTISAGFEKEGRDMVHEINDIKLSL